ncbi:MAG: DUF4177 domain-containing protein [Verrucomicrobiales bacterium]|nr:DUF4177 domain-containing protein [Verrucomicrobiales bacterium]
MTKVQGSWVISLLVILIGLLGVITFGARFQAAPKWEYRLESPSDLFFESELDRLGKDGWELVSARRATSSYGDGASYEMIFKRPRRH